MTLHLKHLPYYKQLMRTDKPIGTLLLLWPTLWALWIASDGIPSWQHLIIFSLGVFVMRSAGCVINDYADRDFDGKVKRTQNRPLAQGVVSEKEALSLFALLVVCAFMLVLLLNWQTIVLSVGGLILAASYPFMKRYTHLPQVVLGAAFSWSIPMAFMAVTEQVPLIAWLLYAINLVWTVAYDTMYGMVDRDDDVKIGVKSTAILFGRFDKVIVAFLQLVTLLGLVWLGYLLQLGVYFEMGILVVLLLFAWQQNAIKKRERDACFKAFLHNNYVGLMVFLAIVISYW